MSESELTVPETGSATYTVVLDTAPTGAVTVTVAKEAGGDANLTAAPTTLTFTTTDWSTAQTVTVSAADDVDTDDGTATFTHSASGGGYDDVDIASVLATEADDDTAGVSVSESELTVPETGSATYTVVLDTAPTGAVTVTVAKEAGGDADLTASPTTLTFTTTDWNTAQTVTVSAADDADTDDGTATFTHSASGGGYDDVDIASVSATEADDDAAGVAISESKLTVPEAGSATYTAVLDTAPTAAVEIAVAKEAGGDADLTVAPSSLTFTTSNWDTAQTVTVSAADDDDAAAGTATITHTASSTDSGYNGITIDSLTATESDNDAPGVTVDPETLSVTEESTAAYTVVLDTLPTGPVTVSVAKTDGDDDDLTVSPAALTFTTDDWSTAQTVTVSAADDVDSTNGAATFTHSASGADYGSVVIDSVKATESDNDMPGVTVNPEALSVTEESTATYTVVLTTEPTNNVTVTPTVTGDSDISVSGALTFTTTDWNVAQTVTVSAAADADTENGTATITHTASGGGYGSVSIASVTATEADNDPPAKPTGFTVTAQGHASIELAWTDPGDATITRYEFRYKSSSPGTYNAWQTIPDSDANTVSHLVTGLTVGNNYLFQIRAVNGNGPSPGSTAMALTAQSAPPPKPTGVTATAGNKQVTLMWADPGDGSISRYEYRQKTTGAYISWVQIPGSGASTTDYTVTGLNNGVNYTFQVRAVRERHYVDRGLNLVDTKEGAASDEVMATPIILPEVTLSETSLTVTEGDSATYTAVLATLPTGPVTVNAAKTAGGDDDLTVAPTALTFTTANWNTAQTVTVSAADDDDAAAGTATFTHTASSTDSGYNGITIASVTATEDDDDTVGVTVDPETLSVTEESTAAYTVVLDTLPTGPVTVSVAKTDGGDDDLTVSPAALTFTTDDWSTAQTVTVSAADDVDSTNGAATFTHSASGADYGSVVIDSVKATESDNDTPGVTVDPETLSVTEESTAAYTVVLDTLPTGPVTVSVAKQSGGDDDLTVSPAELTFTTDDWSTAQTVTVSAADDVDGTNGAATFTHSASGADYGSVVIDSVKATESDNDTPGVTVDPETLSVTEGSTASYTVALTTQPTADVMVSLSRSGDSDLTVSTTALTFTTSNWNTAQTVTVSAAADADTENGTATVTHTATSTDSDYSGITIASVTATESDNALCKADSTAISAYSGAGIVADCNTLLGLMDELRDTASLNWSADTAMASWDGITVSGDRVTKLALSNNELTGSIPSELSQLTSLTSLSLDENQLSGSIPSELGQLTSLTWLWLGENLLTGSIPSELGQLTSLTSLNLDGNQLSGSIPSELGQLTSLTELWLDNNQLSGSIPTELGQLTSLTHLNLQSNQLTGSIPSELSQLTSLAWLGLNANQLTGCIPVALSKFESSINPQQGDVDLPVCLAPPTGLSATAGDGQVTLSWTAPSGTVTRYQFRQSSDGGSTYGAWMDASGAATTHTVTGLTNGVAYTFQVRAVNTAVNGAASAAATATLALQVRVSESDLTVPENDTATYTLVLDTVPTGEVTVTVAKADGGDTDLTADPSTLTFTTANWNTAQTVTVSAADDADTDDGAATFTHSASGGGYDDAVIASVSADEADDDVAGVSVSESKLTVPEGGSATYTVALDTPPTAAVAIAVAKEAGGDADLTVAPSALTFTTSNWNTAQTVTVTAADDDDAAAGAATIAHTASSTDSVYNGITIPSVTATEDDNDEAGVTVSPETLTVTENGSEKYTVVLDTRPTGTVRVAVGKADGGDPSLTRSPTSLTFTVSNWSTPKTVTVRAADDVDSTNDTATFTHTATSTADSDYAGITIASVEATEADDDTPGVRVSRTALTVSEGRSATYTVALNTLPTGSVTVAVAASGDSDSDLTAAPTSLTFTTTDWNRAQTVTVSAADDGDAEDGTATFTNTPSGADYASVTGANVTAREDDNDEAGVTVTPTRLTVNETGSETYTVVLDTLPTAAVTVGVAASGDSDLTVSASSLTFSTSNWSTAQTVTVSAADDDDDTNGGAVFAHRASGAGEYAGITIASVNATEADDDTAGVKLSATALTVTEGSSATYTVELNTLPPGNVTVRLSRRTGDSDLTVSPTRLTFTTDNWNTAQTATVSAAEDDDAAAGEATIRNLASGTGYSGRTAELTATEDDNDTAGVTVSASTLTVNETGSEKYTVVLDTRPTGTVRVAVGKEPGGDPSLTRSPTSLTFTVSNWSTPKTVTVRAADDVDSTNDTATFTHTATSTADSDYAGITIASVTATERDDDTPGVRLSRSSVTVNEGSSATYTVKLNTLPTGSVTVAVAASGDSDSDLTAAPTSLTFTTTDWNRAQTVTVSAADDGDAEDGTATFTNTPSGADYASVTGANVTATEKDNDTAGVTVTPTRLTVNETGSATYTVVLDTLPTAAVTVGVAASGDSDLTVSASSLTFSTSNWSTAQTVTVSAADDVDPDPGTATIAHTASGAGEYAGISIASVTATEKDDDTPGVKLSTNALTVTEGSSATYTVELNTLPPGNVTVRLSRRTGDSDLTVSPTRLTFTTDNWNTAQTATVSAAEDDDAAVGKATIRNLASGTGYSGRTAELTATEDDNDTAGVTVSATALTVNETGSEKYTVVLDTRPTGTVRVAVGKEPGGDPSLTRSPTSLTFTVSNWSTPKTVTVRAADDVDSTNDTATFTHTATSTADSDYAGITIASVTATERDDDTPGVRLSRSSVTVNEGSSATYTVALNTLPTGSVTVAVAASGDSDSDLTAAPTSLTFTTTDWNRAQTVTVSAADDGDAEDGTATFTNTPSGADYASVTGANVTAREKDNDEAGVTVSTTALTVNETGSATYTVVLDTLPTAAVTVAVAKRSGGDADLTVSASSLTFSTSNWSTAQTVTVSAADDVDPDPGTATIAHTASGAGEYAGISIASVTATEKDDDTPGVKLSTTALTVTEGSSATYTVELNTLPPGNVTVRLSRRTGDSDLTVSPAALTFTTANWNTAQTATVSAAEDDDAAVGKATIRNLASGTGYSGRTAELTATEDDNDTAGVTVSATALTVNETGSEKYTVVLDTRPTGTVRVAVGKEPGGDPSLTRSPTSLTFTVSNWSTPKTVTVRAADDVDSTNDTATFTHTATSTADSDYAGITIASVTATERDDDTPGVRLSRSSVTVNEGSSATYTVALNTLPTGSVTVAVAASGDSDSDLTAAPTSLTFTTTDWNRAQTVTVSAADDGDAEDGTATFTNTPSGADYASVTGANVTATEKDNDTAGVTVTPRSLTVNETGSATYTVVLDTLPTAAVTVAVAKRSGGDADLTVSASSLTFSTSNWSTAQTVTVSAADDVDPDPGTATIAHTASGAGEYAGISIASVTATEKDDDTPGVKLSTNALTVTEGGSATYTVELNTLPPGNVTVRLSRRTGDSDLTVSPTRLTFTTDNWNTAQTATVSAAEDDDAAVGKATIRNLASGTGYSGRTAELTATEDDNDTAGVTVSASTLTVNETGSEKYTVVLDTRPTGTVRVAVGKEPGGDPSLTRSPTSLTFTVSKWSTPKTVTVRAADDVDSTNDTATFTHTATSTADDDYDDIAIASVEATEADDDMPGVQLSRTELTVLEGRSATYTVRLNTEPTAAVTVTPSAAGDSDISVSGALTFTTGTWSRAQTVTVSAADDADTADGTATITHAAASGDGDYSGITIDSVTATEADDDVPGVTVTPKTLRVSEDSSATYTVVLKAVPTATVTVTVAKQSGGDEHLTVSPTTLTFTTTDWETAQTVTVSAAEDADTANGTATITHAAASGDGDYNGITIDSVRAREADNDTAANAVPTFTSGATFTVAENETAVGTVVATDSDDRITDFALLNFYDKNLFTITNANINARTLTFTLTFKEAPDYESPADADTDNAYVVVVEVTSGAGERVMTATQTLTVTVTDVEAPSAPSAPAVSGETASSVTVSWTAPANPGSAITGYDVQYRVSGAASWTDAGYSGTGLTLTLTGLTAGTDYQVQVRATNAEGTGAWSATAIGTTTATVAANVAPTFTSGATFTVAENETAVGTVVAMDSDADDRITGYTLTGGADRAQFSITSAGALTFNTAPDYESPTDADTDNVYVVEVEATSGAGERVMTATQAITVTVTDQSEVPSAPPAPVISSITATGFTVTWTAPANPGSAITDYDVQYRVSGAASWTDAGHSGTGLTLTLTGLTASTDYEVQVRATNAEGPGAWSATATATTTAVNVAPTFTSGAMFTVAENETAVGTVVATDSDAGDTVTGYALTGGADRAQFSITSAGALTFDTAPDYESPADADTDNAYVVVVEATSGAGERVMTATQAITVTVTDQSETPSAPSAPAISGETASSVTVSWTAPANPGSAITGYDVQYRVSGAASWTDAGHSGTGLSLTLTGLTASTDYEVQVRASNAEGTGAWSATAIGTTTANEAAERIERVTETVQPEVSRAMVSGTLEVVTQRIERPEDGGAQVSLSGRSSFSELLQSHEAALNGEVELDWRRVLGTSSFSLPLSETDQPGAGGGLEVWGRGAWRSLSGGSAGELTWKGEMLSAHLGADWRLRPELLAGVALSWHEGDVDYDDDGAKGTSRSRMTSVHPYLGWFPSEESSLWMSAGYGRGTVVVDDEGRHSGDSEMRMVGAGGRVRVLSSEGWLGGGTSSLDVKGEGWVARTEISGNGGMLADDTVDARRVRLALEGAHERRLASGSVLTPVLELGVRHDGGDGETGVGVEIGAGLRYADADAGLSSEVRVRALAAHQGALEEWGVSGMVRYAPGASGRGVSFSVTSSLGAPGSGMERLWEQGLGNDASSVAVDDKATPSALRLESELGYGFSAMGGAGVLTPYGGFTFSEESARRYRLGVRLERKPALSLELKVERSETTTDTDHGIFLKGALRW